MKIGIYKYLIFSIILLAIANVNFAQTKDCHPDCGITFEQLFQMRCPPFTRAVPDESCYKKVMDKIESYKADDRANFDYLRNVACSHASNWTEIKEGECNAGGPPPCCPVQHWRKDPQAWTIFKNKMSIVKEKRATELEKIFEGCTKNLKNDYVTEFNNYQNLIVSCLDKLKSDVTVYTQAANEYNQLKATFKDLLSKVESKLQPAEVLKTFIDHNLYNFKEKVCNYKPTPKTDPSKSDQYTKEGDDYARQGKYDEADKKYQQAITYNPNNTYAKNQKQKNLNNKNAVSQNNNSPVQNNSSNYREGNTSTQKTQDEINAENNKKIFDEKSAIANQKQQAYDASEASTRKSLGYLSVLWIGAYMFHAPKTDCYNQKGLTFSFGPYNSFIIAPTYKSKTNEVYYSNNTTKTDNEGSTNSVATLNFGIKPEIAYYSDNLQIVVPIRAHVGMLTNQQENINWGSGIHIFAGKKNWERLKISIGFDFNWYLMSKRFYDSSTSPETSKNYGFVRETTEINDATFILSTFKFGIRSHKYFTTKNTNTESPFVLDVFFTLNQINERSINPGFNTYKHKIAPGLEFNINKINLFGMFAKVMFISPVGELKYKLPNGISVGDKTFPYLEIGVKRDYTFFRKQK